MRETKNGKQQAGSHLSLLLSKKRRSFAESQDIKLQISYIMEDEEKVSGLPENAYRELKEGEVYKPILSPDKQYREVTPWPYSGDLSWPSYSVRRQLSSG